MSLYIKVSNFIISVSTRYLQSEILDQAGTEPGDRSLPHKIFFWKISWFKTTVHTVLRSFCIGNSTNWTCSHQRSIVPTILHVLWMFFFCSYKYGYILRHQSWCSITMDPLFRITDRISCCDCVIFDTKTWWHAKYAAQVLRYTQDYPSYQIININWKGMRARLPAARRPNWLNIKLLWDETAESYLIKCVFTFFLFRRTQTLQHRRHYDQCNFAVVFF